MIEQKPESSQNLIILYDAFTRILISDGLTKQELDQIKGYPVGIGSVEKFVDIALRLGHLEWKGNLLVNRPKGIRLDLTYFEEMSLKDRAKHEGLTPGQLATAIVLERISS